MSLFRSEATCELKSLNRHVIIRVLFPGPFIIYCRKLRPCPLESEIFETIYFFDPDLCGWKNTIATILDLNLFNMNKVP